MRKDTLATRKRIIDTAERLFAERGVESTSLLEIAKAAEQKNRSALQYHFNNKEGLLDAVLDKHNRIISQARMAMLDALEERGDYSLRDLIEALVQPMASLLDDDQGGRAFLRIHSELLATGAYRELRQRRDRENPDTRRFRDMAAPFLGDPGSEQTHARFLLTGCLLIHGLSAYLAQQDSLARPAFLEVLIQGITDLLQQG